MAAAYNSDDAAYNPTVVAYGIRPVLSGEASSVRAPKNFVHPVRPLPLPEGLENLAFLLGISAPIGPGVVHQRMHVLCK